LKMFSFQRDWKNGENNLEGKNKSGRWVLRRVLLQGTYY
jgi:hypothetical protein